MRDRVHITVPGEPIGKGRPRFGNGRTYTPQKTRVYEAWVRFCAQRVMAGRVPFTGACSVEVAAYLPIPKSWGLGKARKALEGYLLPTGRPDADNLLKAAADSLNGVVWTDDAQVVEARVVKRYSDNPRMEISVVHLEAPDRGVEIVKLEEAA